MKTNVLFSSLSTGVLLNTSEYSEVKTLQVMHGGISVAFTEDSQIATKFFEDMDDIAGQCMGDLDDDEDLKYARKMIALCRKFCNVHG